MRYHLALKIFIAAILGGFLPSIVGSNATASPYSCGTPEKSHCYGSASWNDSDEIFATSTVVWPVTMHCNNCDGFVNVETWLLDYSSPKCRANKFTACWIEVGFIRQHGRKNTDLFWADARPGHGFSEHWLGATTGVTSDIQFVIAKDTSAGASSTTYFIAVDEANLSAVALHAGRSTANTMRAMTQMIGQELAGSHGSSADVELFRQTQVSHRTDQFAVPGALTSRSTNGFVKNDNPPLAGWLFQPANLPGGGFVTACCDATFPTPLSATKSTARPVPLNRVRALLAQSQPSSGTAAIQGPLKGVRAAKRTIADFVKAQSALGRVSLQAPTVRRVDFLDARRASDRAGGIDLGVPGASPVILATLAGRFAVAGPQDAKTVLYTTAVLVFDARSGNLLMLSLPDS